MQPTVSVQMAVYNILCLFYTILSYNTLKHSFIKFASELYSF